MRILVTGREGQLGWELTESLGEIGSVVAVGKKEMDLSDAAMVEKVLEVVRPDLIVNAGAYTAVDRAETERSIAYAVNAEAPAIMARYAARNGALMIHFSTDYVFDGNAGRPYVESDAAAPLMEYGRSKLAGEQEIQRSGAAALILRTSWVYSYRRTNFVSKMIELFRQRSEVSVVDDQIGSPTYAPHLAYAVAGLVARMSSDQLRNAIGPGHGGLLHLAARGETSWFGFASAILAQVRSVAPDGGWKVERLVPIASLQYPSPAQRPADSRLDCSLAARLLSMSLPQWHHGLDLCVRRVLDNEGLAR